jgi:SAM-dependent methyltransferase
VRRSRANIKDVRRGGGAERPFVSYAHYSDGEGQYRAEVRRIIDDGAKRICDVGGGAKPVVGLPRVQERGLDYVVLDASSAQLDRTDSGYERRLGSILDADVVNELIRDKGPFDAIVSHFVAEHISDGQRFHEQVFDMLRPGGRALHYFPTLYAPPFVVNRVLDSRTSAAIALRLFNKRNKFPAQYSWCRGPSRRQLAMLEAIGYSIDRYVGYFGHSFYVRIKPLHAVHEALTARLLEHPRASATSFALVVLRRPR